jgi:hypothetical protein
MGMLVFGIPALGVGDDSAKERSQKTVNTDDKGGTTPHSKTKTKTQTKTPIGFAGVWRGDFVCDYRVESSQGVQSERETVQGESHFNANEDLLLLDQNGQPQAQDRQGLTVNYVLDGGGTGSRQLVLLEKGATTRRYGYRHRENRTRTDRDSSTIYRREAEEFYDFAIVSGKLEIKYSLVSEVTDVVSTQFAGTMRSTTRHTLSCHGSYTRS